MRKNKATRFYQVNVSGNLARLVNARKAMSNLKSDSFKYNSDIEEAGSVCELNFNKNYCFIVNASGKALEVDSIEEAKILFSNI